MKATVPQFKANVKERLSKNCSQLLVSKFQPKTQQVGPNFNLGLGALVNETSH